MFWSFCSAKGGVGTSTLAAATAIELARTTSVLLVDLAGDQPDLLGVTAGSHGIMDWLRADADVGPEALANLVVPVIRAAGATTPGRLELVPRGSHGSNVDPVSMVAAPRVAALQPGLSPLADVIIADLGVLDGNGFDTTALIAAAADRVSLVVRACYIGLRRAQRVGVAVDDVVEVVDGGRALGTLDIEAVLEQPVTARLNVDPSIARAVDAGLMVTRLPRPLRRTARHLLDDSTRTSAA
ncbi:MAG: hypothetical protein ACR2P0_13850 [Acidimicrobiales bacterium]